MRKTLLSVVGLLALVIGMLAPVTMAEAAVSWPLKTDVVPSYVHAFGSDKLQVDDCITNSDNVARAVIINGAVKYSSLLNVGDSSFPRTACTNQNASIDAPDGTVYSMVFTSNGGYAMVADKNGRFLWQTAINQCGNNTGGTVESMVMGSDGKIYALINGGNCTASRLITVNTVNGVISSTQYSFTGFNGRAIGMYAYSGEIAVVLETFKVYYFTNGSLTTPAATSTAFTGTTYNRFWTNSDKAILSTYHTGSEGQSTVGLKYRVKARTASTAMTYSFTTDQNIQPPADGMAIILNSGFVATQAVFGNDAAKLTRYTIPASGSTLVKTSITATTPSGYTEYAGKVYADTNGKVVYFSVLRDQSTSVFGYIVRLFDFTAGTSTVIAQSNIASGTTNYSGIGSGSIYGGYLYQQFCDSGCDTSLTNEKIYKITLTGFGTEYQSSGSFAPSFVTKTEYVALGDSFSSGEGNSPFTPDSSVSGIDECDRSYQAYPFLIEHDIATVDMVSDVACSGAQTTDITGSINNSAQGNWREGPQVNAITSSTKIITLTIGGNDIGFGDYAYACAIGSCNLSSTAYRTVSSKVSNVGAKLTLALNAIKSKIGTQTDVKVLVVGYPNILPEYDSATAIGCPPYLAEPKDGELGAYFDTSDIQAANEVISDLNSAVSSSVTSVSDSRFEYVDATANGSPFSGHTLCDSTPYFKGLIESAEEGAPDLYTFHPNSYGQQAYATLIESYL